MTRPVSILLPGLDGTGDLFKTFIDSAPAEWRVETMRLPHDKPRGYVELADCLRPELPTAPIALIAESFSGPLAVLLANRCPNVYAVVLCATFVRSPLPALFRYVPDFIWRRPPPPLALSVLMAGGNRALGRELHDAICSVNADVITSRISAVLSVDATGELARVTQPVLCLRPTRDRLVPQRAAAQIKDIKPSAGIVNIEAPHLVLQTRPVDCWSAIASFLDGAYTQSSVIHG